MTCLFKFIRCICVKLKKNYRKITASDWLNFAGVILGIFMSFLTALVTFDLQDEATKDLANRLKLSEIITSVHVNVRSCKNLFNDMSRKIKNSNFAEYESIISTTIFDCRSNLLPFVSGLKVFKENDEGKKIRTYLKKLDDRMLEVYALTIEKDAHAKLKKINDSTISLVIGDDKNLPTLDGLEKLLLE